MRSSVTCRRKYMDLLKCKWVRNDLRFCTAEFSKMKDELPDSFKKGLETASEKEESKKTTPTSDKESVLSEQGTQETTPTEEKVSIAL